MKTPTHMVLGLIVARLLPGKGSNKSRWVVLGAAAPDLPLITVAAGCWVAAHCGEAGFMPSCFIYLVDRFYFGDPIFMTMHHLLHSPTSLLLMIGVWYVAGRPFARRALWFLAGATSHALVDLFTHARDGILIFWPFNWSYRFDAGVNQFDLSGAGLVLVCLEGTILVGFLTLAGHRFIRRKVDDVVRIISVQSAA